MSNYDEMTKEELLEEAKAQGISPANAGMSKAELREALEAGPAPGEESLPQPGEQATTLKTKDYLGRSLNNATPGTTQATDQLARAVLAGDKDFLGRTLI